MGILGVCSASSKRSQGSQTAAVVVAIPYGRTELCAVRALARWLSAAEIADLPVFRRIQAPPQRDADSPPPLPAVGLDALTARSVARTVQSRAALVGFRSGDFGGHSLKHSELTTGMQAGAHAAQLKRLGRHKSFAVVGEYLERGDLFADHPLADAL